MKMWKFKQTYSFPIEIIPWKRPLLPPKTGSKANSKPTAQSWNTPKEKMNAKAPKNQDFLNSTWYSIATDSLSKFWSKRYLKNKCPYCNLTRKRIVSISFYQKLYHLDKGDKENNELQQIFCSQEIGEEDQL